MFGTCMIQFLIVIIETFLKILPFTAVNVVKRFLLFQVTSPRDKIGQCATPPNLYFIHDP